MLKTSPTLIVLQSLIDAAGNNEDGGDENNGNETNLSNLFTFKKSFRTGYITSEGAKKDSGNPNRAMVILKKVSKPLKALIT